MTIKPLTILKLTGKVIIGIFITYAVLFSIATTIAGIYVYKRGFHIYEKLSTPVRAVQKLKTENPKETLYMISHRKKQFEITTIPY